MATFDLARLDEVSSVAEIERTAGATPTRETQPRTSYSLSSPAPSAPASDDPKAALRLIDYFRPEGSAFVNPILRLGGGLVAPDAYGSVTTAKIDELRPRPIVVTPLYRPSPVGRYAPGQVPVNRPPERIGVQLWTGPLVNAKADELAIASEARQKNGAGVGLLVVGGAALLAFL